MTQGKARRRSGRRLLIAGVAVMLVAAGLLIFVAVNADDSPSAPSPSSTAGQTTTAPSTIPSTTQSEGAPSTGSSPTRTEGRAESAPGAADPSVIGQITALIGALTGLVLAVTGLVKMLRTPGPPE